MAYLKGVELSGSSEISGSNAEFDQITGSFIKGDGSDITGVISSSYATTASHALNVPVTASYAITSSYIEIAQTASYIAGANVDGTVTSASYATTASYALNVPVTASYALTASYVEIAQTSSYVAGANVDGTV